MLGGMEMLHVMDRILNAEGFSHWACINLSGDDSDSKAEELFQLWVQMGNQGQMDWIEGHGSKKFRPQTLLEGAKSILVVSLPYFQKIEVDQPFSTGQVARYAWGRDYHKVFQKKLRKITESLGNLCPGEKWRSGADSHPLGEVHFAQKAGLGFRGRHTLCITKPYGSWHLLGIILTTCPLPEKSPPEGPKSCPSWCFLCGQRCPTGALIQPGYIDARLCISYWTIETLDPVPEDLRAKFGTWIFGCDLCQDECPYNRDPGVTSEPDFLHLRNGPWLDLASLLDGNEEEWKQRLQGTPLARAGYLGLVRNACLAAGNSGDKGLIFLLEKWANHEMPGIREHALWSLERLKAR